MTLLPSHGYYINEKKTLKFFNIKQLFNYIKHEKKKSMDSDYTPGEKRSLHSWLLRQIIHLTAEKSLQTFYQIKHLSTYH